MGGEMVVKGMLSGEVGKQYEEMGKKIQGEAISASEEAFGLETTTQLQQLADTLAESRGAIIVYDERATLAPGCKDLAADLQALAVLTGNVNRAGSGIGPLFEDANSLGARDMGLLPDALPGYRPVVKKGLPYNEMLSSPRIKALYVMGANPARHVAHLPPQLEYLVVQDITLTETARRADVVFPAGTFAEKDGSMTNADHHMQANRHSLRPLPGAKAYWQILVALANVLGQKWTYNSPQEVLLEIANTNPFYTGLTWEDLGVRTQEQEGSVLLSEANRATREGKVHPCASQ